MKTLIDSVSRQILTRSIQA